MVPAAEPLWAPSTSAELHEVASEKGGASDCVGSDAPGLRGSRGAWPIRSLRGGAEVGCGFDTCGWAELGVDTCGIAA
eukprot:1485781-Prorocentrum_lima.AAC.1